MKTAYNQQLRLQERMGFTFRPGRAHLQAIKDWILAAHTELSEALQSLPWKPWKNYSPSDYGDWDREHFLEELLDVQHFLFNAAAYAGFTAEEYQAAWDTKHQINHDRLTEETNKVLELEAQ